VTRPRYLPGPKARRVEQLLALERYSLRAIERRADGDYALVLWTQKIGRAHVRALRLTEHRVERVKPTTLARHLHWRLGVTLTVDEALELRWLIFAFALADDLRQAGITFTRVNGRRAA
jgi:hypothetical protein